MAKIRPAAHKKGRGARPGHQGIPCLLLILSAFVLVFLLLYAAMRSGI
jgi:hypothetical protein